MTSHLLRRSVPGWAPQAFEQSPTLTACLVGFGLLLFGTAALGLGLWWGRRPPRR